jgi:hypothetical protein
MSVTPYSQIEVCRRFLNLFRNTSSLLLTDFFLGVFFGPEDGGGMFLRNVKKHVIPYTKDLLINCVMICCRLVKGWLTVLCTCETAPVCDTPLG